MLKSEEPISPLRLTSESLNVIMCASKARCSLRKGCGCVLREAAAEEAGLGRVNASEKFNLGLLYKLVKKG